MEKKPKVFIDHQIFTFQNYGGISRVFTELYKEFKRNNSYEFVFPVIFSNNEYIGEIKKVSKFFPSSNSFLVTAIMYAINRLYTTIRLLFTDFDIFQPTYYDPYFIPFLKKKPFVLLIHDMTHEIFPEDVSKKDRTIVWKKKLVEKADRILAISESTKKDIIKFYDVSEEKVDIVNWSTSLRISNKEIDIDLPNKYILYVGNRKSYKNFPIFIEAVSDILRKDKDMYVVCAGSGKFIEEEIKLLEDLKIKEQVVHLKFKDDDELAYIYNKALCFVFPSLYEGFGIPVLEAFACNCPAVISNGSSLPEVGGDAVEYFDPKDLESIRNSVNRVVFDNNLRDEMIKKGCERLKLFSWEKASKKFLDVYNDIIN